MRKTMRFLIAVALLLGTAWSAEADWPREMDGSRGLVTMYQPQIERFDGNVFEARAAVSVTPADGAPLFGAVWVESQVDTDRVARTVEVRETVVKQVRFPEASDEDRERLASFLEAEIPTWHLVISLDRIVADLDNGEKWASTPGIKSVPPKIVLSIEPAVLVVIDGEPVLKELTDVSGADLETVVNTPFPIVRDSATDTYYLSGGGSLWYGAPDVEGPWQVTTSVPDEVAPLAIEADDAEAEGAPPKIIVATEPTELIVSDGKPKWSPVEGMDLLYMDNTDSDVFLEISTQMYYVLLSGRWYRGAEVGDVWEWVNVPNDEVPPAFAAIPEDSPNGDVLTQVAGTVQAREAALDNSIPQTSAIRRDDASLEVAYDGTPEFEPVQDVSDLEYAVNTASPVFLVGGRYYACEQAVWYESTSPNGPWIVAAHVPESIYFVPASHPHHNVTYVKVYQATPEIVYVGYTPGYVGSYYYSGVVVYGTGYHYNPWYGPYYYPRPATWGFHVSYNPWTGWGFGVSWSHGPFTFGVASWGHHHHHHGWFGPGGYHPHHRPYVGHGYRKTDIDIDRNVNINIGDRGRPGGRPGTRPGGGGNLYDRADNQKRNSTRPPAQNRKRPGVESGKRNDVFADRDGNVYRRNDSGGWQQRDQGKWKPADDLDRGRGQSSRPGRDSASGSRVENRAPSTSGSRAAGTSRGATRPQLEQDHRARQRGTQRSAQGGSRSRPSRGGRSGGRRR